MFPLSFQGLWTSVVVAPSKITLDSMHLLVLVHTHILCQGCWLCKETDGELSPLAVDEETDEDDGNIATSIGLVIVYIFVGYFFVLFCIVAIFCVCFVRCNCTCVKCCNSSYCMRPKCSPKLLRTQRFKIKCPQSVSTRADTLYSASLEKCCPCCSDIDACDSDELAFWTEIVILVILCLPFAICFIVIYAYAIQAT